MEAANVPGLSMAVFRGGKIFWNKAFGVKSRQTNEPVEGNTMFEAASLTKTVTAYAAMRLVERGELDLDKPLHEYFPNQVYPKLSGDERYKKLTARLVLTHTTGLPNWGNKLMRDPGLQYGYSGEGFLYLADSNNGLAIAEALTALVFPDHQYALDWLEYEKYDDPKRLGRISIEAAFTDEGIEAGMKKLQEAREAFPDLAKEELLIEMARNLGENGKQEEAIALLKVCLESYPQSVDARLGLGLAFMGMGRNRAAIESFEAALKISKDNGIATRGLQWANDALKTEKNQVVLSAAEMEKLAGDYGQRHIKLREGRLYYQRDGRPEYRLLPLSRETFALERYGQFRVRFVSDEAGQVTKLVGLYIYGNTVESPRDR
jgi:tetratricopeptide (TPR) repeat protein